MTDNLLLLTDSYKPSHWKQYPPGTEAVYSYLTARGGDDPFVVWFGAQYPVARYLAKPITLADFYQAKTLLRDHLSPDIFNANGWMHVIQDHGGLLPLTIRTLPEGSLVPTQVPLMTVVNNCPRCFWATNYVESLLVQTWYPMSVATRSRRMKVAILRELHRSGTPETIDFKLHDFGFRGSTSSESSAWGGLAHLVNFKGTDTLPALVMAQQYYGEPMAGFSIPAAEHSTITAWGRSREADAYANMLAQFPGAVAVVSDSYDVFHACEALWGGVLHDRVMERDGLLVIRPDSGDPPAVLGRLLEILGDKFGSRMNTNGYRVLPDNIRLIQGDGIDEAMLRRILSSLAQDGWSADNLAFGSGGGLLQKDLNRDTHKVAFKASAVQINGEWCDDIQKDPITDPGKKSMAGRFGVVRDAATGLWATVSESALVKADLDANELHVIYHNGRLMNQATLGEVRSRAAVKAFEYEV